VAVIEGANKLLCQTAANFCWICSRFLASVNVTELLMNRDVVIT